MVDTKNLITLLFFACAFGMGAAAFFASIVEMKVIFAVIAAISAIFGIFYFRSKPKKVKEEEEEQSE